VAVAGTSKTSFYETWGSRDDCLRWLLDQLGERLVIEVQGGAAVGSDPADRLRRGLAGFVHGCASDGRLARLLLVESVGVGGPVEESRRKIQDRFARMVEAEVREAAAGGEESEKRYREVDATVFGRAVVGATQEATAKLIAEPAPDPLPVIRGLWAIFAPAEAP
jgi:AcrR family transcriptional regulator